MTEKMLFGDSFNSKVMSKPDPFEFYNEITERHEILKDLES